MRRARIQFLLGALLIAVIMVVYVYRRRLIGLDDPIASSPSPHGQGARVYPWGGPRRGVGTSTLSP